MLNKYDKQYALNKKNKKPSPTKKKPSPTQRREENQREKEKIREKLGLATPRPLGDINNPRPLPGSFGSGKK